MSRKITITQALSELKLLDSRIEKLAHNSVFITFEHNNFISGFTGKDVASKELKSAFDKITQLIANRTELKGKIAQSNAATSVTIGTHTMTVAEAIERKSSIKLEEELLASVLRQLSAVYRKRDQIESKIEQEISARTQALITASGNSKPAKSTMDDIANTVRAANKLELVDPNNLYEVSKALTDSINEFKLHVDVSLSVANATTHIELSF